MIMFSKKQLNAIPKEELIDMIIDSRDNYEFERKVNNFFYKSLNNICDEMEAIIDDYKRWEELNKKYNKLDKLWSESNE